MYQDDDITIDNLAQEAERPLIQDLPDNSANPVKFIPSYLCVGQGVYTILAPAEALIRSMDHS